MIDANSVGKNETAEIIQVGHMLMSDDFALTNVRLISHDIRRALCRDRTASAFDHHLGGWLPHRSDCRHIDQTIVSAGVERSA
jgi:hypothetical protein